MCSFSRIGQNIRKLQLFEFLLENFEKFRSIKLHCAPLEESNIFLYRSSLGRKSLESSRLGRPKNAISEGQGVRLENKSHRKCKNWHFPSTIFKHGLLEGSTFWFHDSYTCCTPLESSRLGQLKYAISPSKDLRSKKKKTDLSRGKFNNEKM